MVISCFKIIQGINSTPVWAPLKCSENKDSYKYSYYPFVNIKYDK